MESEKFLKGIPFTFISSGVAIQNLDKLKELDLAGRFTMIKILPDCQFLPLLATNIDKRVWPTRKN